MPNLAARRELARCEHFSGVAQGVREGLTGEGATPDLAYPDRATCDSDAGVVRTRPPPPTHFRGASSGCPPCAAENAHTCVHVLAGGSLAIESKQNSAAGSRDCCKVAGWAAGAESAAPGLGQAKGAAWAPDQEAEVATEPA